ncbi:MAG: phosphoribosylglycinamide formyltransferase [Chloroflexi bacterium]|nr:phosphoribosylglycinamide formyltransferase [Chloroflexota bacterium]
MRLGVLVSGRGSNLEAVLRAGFAVALVISNRRGVRALEIAAAHDVPVLVLRRADHGGDPSVRDEAIGAALRSAAVDLTVLAGYDQRLRPSYFAAYPGRTINIHPSLLPAHGGPRMLGPAVHRSVLDAGDAESGVTIHEVTPDLDAGAIVAQSRVAVVPGDAPDTLAARVLVEEHRLLVETLAEIAAHRR